jgi:hypothetical protein
MLLSVSAILAKTLEIYRKHTRYFVLYMVWTFLITFGLNFFEDAIFSSHIIPSEGLAFLIFVILSLIIAIIGIWLYLGLFVAAKRAIDNEKMESFGMTMRMVTPYLPHAILVTLLLTLYLTIGTFALVFPGIILAIWYAFAVFNVLFLDQKVGEAMATSKSLSLGRWWAVAWRLVAPSVIIMAIATLVQYIILSLFSWRYIWLGVAENPAIILNSFVVALLYAFIFPMIIIAILLVYFDLRANPLESRASGHLNPPPLP